MGFEVLHGIADCLWVVGNRYRSLRRPWREKQDLTEVETNDGITFLPMRNGTGAYNRYLERLNTGKIKIREVMARKGDTPEYVNKMQHEVFRGPGRSK